MSKRKADDSAPAGAYDPLEEAAGTAAPSAPDNTTWGDKMAVARAARKRGGRNKRPAAVPIGATEWMLVGFKRDPYRAFIIGTAPNRFQLRKKFDAMKELAAQMYDGVYVVRGKRFDVNSL